MTGSKQLSRARLAALIEYATNDTVYGITREDRKILNVLRSADDFAETKD
ncbi:MAG: hypothetical protein ACP5NS_01845 [Candidatus Pacearchaeota archaeon]